MSKYKQLKQKIRDANPDKFDLIAIAKINKDRPRGHLVSLSPDKTIRLADVLLAIQKRDIGCLFNPRNSTMFEHIGYCCGDKLFMWNLKEDLDNQSKETKEFLINTLVDKIKL